MKRFFILLSCLLLVVTLATPAMAAGMEVVFSSDSVFDVGGTVSVDRVATISNIADNGFSEHYNAFLEGNVQYFWYRDDVWDESLGSGDSATFNESHRGCTFYCQAVLYGDEERTMQVGSATSKSFTIGSLPEITTRSIPDATLGVPYYTKLECTDSDATFQLLQSSLPGGMTLTQHGEIEGTPTQTGFFHINVLVTDPYGIENCASFEFTVYQATTVESTPADTIPTDTAATVYAPADPTVATVTATEEWVEAHVHEDTTDSLNKESEASRGGILFSPVILTVLLVLVIVVLAIALIGAVVLIIILLFVKRKR